MKRKGITILILSILCISLMPIAGFFENRFQQAEVPNTAYTPIDNILITSNAELATFCNGNGTGTAEDPYIIEKYSISEDLGRISISNTDAYLCIRNNTINGSINGITIQNAQNVNISSNLISNDRLNGIYVRESQNILVFGNKINNSNGGISLYEADNVGIIGNTITDSEEGIEFIESKYLDVLSNTIKNISESGIIFTNSYSSQFSGNNFEDCLNHAIIIGNTRNLTFTDNIFTRCGIFFDGIVKNTTIDTSNKVNGNSIRYYEQQNNISIINEADIGQLILNGVNNSEIRGLNVSYSGIGITIMDSHYNTFSDINSSYNYHTGISLAFSTFNSFSDMVLTFNAKKGIYLWNSMNNSIMKSSIENNRVGASIDNAGYNKIAGNEFKNNTNHGIYIGGFTKCNRIYYNVFTDNGIHAESSPGNYWDDGKKGNYWGDYSTKYPNASNNGIVWNIPYTVLDDGETLEQDRYPLAILPFTIVESAPILTTPSNESSTGIITLKWDSILEAEHYLVYRSNSEITDVESLTPIASATAAEYTDNVVLNGTYFYIIVAVNEFNSSKNLVSNNVQINVAIPPSPPQAEEPDQPDQDDEPSTIDGFPFVIFGIVCVISLIVKRRRVAI